MPTTDQGMRGLVNITGPVRATNPYMDMHDTARDQEFERAQDRPALTVRDIEVLVQRRLYLAGKLAAIEQRKACAQAWEDGLVVGFRNGRVRGMADAQRRVSRLVDGVLQHIGLGLRRRDELPKRTIQAERDFMVGASKEIAGVCRALHSLEELPDGH